MNHPSGALGVGPLVRVATWLRDVALVVTAVAMTPLFLRGEALGKLLKVPVRCPAPGSQAERPLHWSNALLRVLGRAPLPRSPWRNTCLYRSVAGCLVLRGLGHPVRVVLGVRRGTAGTVQAHAWLEGYDRLPPRETAAADRYTTMAPLTC